MSELLELPPDQALRSLERLFASMPGDPQDEFRELAANPDPDLVAAFIHDYFDPLPDDIPRDTSDDSAPSLPGRAAPNGPFGQIAYRRLDNITSELQHVDSRIAALEARRIELLASADRWAAEAAEVHLEVAGSEAERRELADRTVRLELSCALRISRTSMAAQMTEAAHINALPATLEALRTGRIGRGHAVIIADACQTLPTEAVPAFESELATIAAGTTTAVLRKKARVLREQRHPESIEVRARSAREERRVVFEPGEDNMGWLHLYAPNVSCLRMYEALTEAGVSLQGRNERRTLHQLRADALTEFVLGTGRFRAGAFGERTRAELDALAERARETARPRIFATVPMLSLLGLSEEPATIEGLGPVDPPTARELVAEAPSLYRVLTHPVTGTVLDVDRTSYRVPADLRRWLVLRDGGCRAPFSTTASTRCDIDHTRPWDDFGSTRHDNLAHVSRGWHTAKHSLGWRVRQDVRGVLTWTSPAGREYSTLPAVPIGRADRRSHADRNADSDPPPF